MRTLAFSLLAAIAFPAFAARPATTELVTVAQLEETIASVRQDSDGAAAHRLSEMRLTERLSEARAAELEAQLPGKQAREQLQVLADESAFLQAAPEDVLPDPPPDAATRAALLTEASTGLKDAMASWPSYSAVRDTTRFEGTSTVLATGLQSDLETAVGIRMLRSPSAENWECPNQPRLPLRRMDRIEHAPVSILYRHGRFVQAMTSGAEFACTRGGVNTGDEFGELLVLLPRVLQPGNATWGHWESAGGDKVAVFRFAATVNYVAKNSGKDGRVVELRGEVALNARNGEIERMSQIHRWQLEGRPREYDTEVEFGPEEIGGNRYLLPVRRVAMYMTPILKPRTSSGDVEHVYKAFHLERSPLQEYLVDVRFEDYREYGAPNGTPETSMAAKGQP